MIDQTAIDRAHDAIFLTPPGRLTWFSSDLECCVARDVVRVAGRVQAGEWDREAARQYLAGLAQWGPRDGYAGETGAAVRERMLAHLEEIISGC